MMKCASHAVLLKFQVFPPNDEISKYADPLYLSEILSMLFLILFFKLPTHSTYLSLVSKQTVTSRHTHRKETPPRRLSHKAMVLLTMFPCKWSPAYPGTHTESCTLYHSHEYRPAVALLPPVSPWSPKGTGEVNQHSKTQKKRHWTYNNCYPRASPYTAFWVSGKDKASD